jgi:hypothetical protein
MSQSQTHAGWVHTQKQGIYESHLARCVCGWKGPIQYATKDEAGMAACTHADEQNQLKLFSGENDAEKTH